ncbi:FHA domain-containing protein [Halobacteriovorax sp. GB3]|uniref:FHA domain-containing protein n=1 Tax=Halobacteriovorax sp. GB3 TaxID=2719615 RepID=UPI0023602560|nr:FHA domain-containing protein [Halobacteriovorax sp. GB3]MDD0854451.1 FHA domain-containing protein [Halobacteriovorax sp. GB3]
MYKLVAVAGKIRGEEFVLESGENSIGRDESCDHTLNIDGVSKKHLSITVTDDVAYLKDLGSSNGTFVNGKIVKRATIKNGDKIALPDVILQVVFVKEKKIVIKKKMAKEEDPEELFLKGGPVPQKLFPKIIYYFKYKFMPIVHGINEEYEWRVLFGILLSIFVVTTITLTIFPILQDSKKLLLREIAKRGAHYAEEIGRINAQALESKNLDRVNSDFLEKEDGVMSYDLFDLEGRIVRPLARLNEYIDDTFSIEVKDWAQKNRMNSQDSRTLTKLLDDGSIGIGKRIIAYNPKSGDFEAVGLIAIRFAPTSLAREAAKSQKAYMEALVTSMIVSIIFFAIIYYLTIRPVEEIKYQIEEVLRGKKRNVETRYLFEEINPLKSSVNSLLQKIRELQDDGGDGEFADIESDDGYVDTLKEFLRGANGAVVILDSEKNVRAINTEAEDLTGIRESSAEGMSLLDVSREKGFAATVLELCEESANNGGYSQQGDYELQGQPHNVYVTSLMGKDNFAKAFYVTFVKDV